MTLRVTLLVVVYRLVVMNTKTMEGKSMLAVNQFVVTDDGSLGIVVKIVPCRYGFWIHVELSSGEVRKVRRSSLGLSFSC